MIDFFFTGPFLEGDAVNFIDLRRLVDNFNDSFDSEGHFGILFVSTIQVTYPLCARLSPEV